MDRHTRSGPRMTLRDAATVMLVRDGNAGLEVFMVRRTLSAAFAGGMYVFPGGAVDAADGGAEVEPLCDGVTDAAASAQLELPAGGLAFWVAAIRECFEEAGVLLARQDGTGDDDPTGSERRRQPELTTARTVEKKAPIDNEFDLDGADDADDDTTRAGRLNEVMQKLTTISTLFLPMTFIASIYGMNFHHMPELDKSWGYPAALAVMAMVGGGFFMYFRSKRCGSW